MGHKPTLQEVSIRRVLDGHSFSEAEREHLVKDAPAEVYIASPKNAKLWYYYLNYYTPRIEERILAGGIRLAWLLNEIYR